MTNLHRSPDQILSRGARGMNLSDEITNMLDEHDLTPVLHDSLHEDIAQLIWSAINASGNYVADHDTYPKEVRFSNGRIVTLSANGSYLVIGAHP